MHDLVMPLALPSSQIDADQGLGKEIVPWAVASVQIGGRRLHRQKDETELFIHRDAGPHTGVAVVGPRIFLPGVAAELAWTRDGVELPDLLAGPHVVRADEPLGVV